MIQKHFFFRFVIPAEQLASASSTYNECIEVNCFDFWPDVESDFVVAAGVKILHCSLTTALNVSSLPNYKNPVSLNYMPHKGITTCVSCLSQSDLFASSGIDGEIHIYKFGKVSLISYCN